MKKKIRWGIMGLGKIANKFASDLQLSNEAELYAVASRNQEKAIAFEEKFHSQKHYDSYEEMAKDEAIDVIYIATPHSFHFENTMLCLKNNKSVLCEKPIGLDSHQVRAMIKEARLRNLFLMEGLWTRFIPATEKLIELLQKKSIGDLQYLQADFGFKADFDPESRVFNKCMGGGSLMDIGIYPIYLSLITLGIPTHLNAIARITKTGVDSYCSMLFGYENGEKAILESSVEADTPTTAHIYGSKGYIKMHSRFHHSKKISLYQDDELKEVFDLKYQGHGYIYEIEEVNRCLRNKMIESPKLPHTLSLDLMAVIDQVKAKIGLTYSSHS
ncbi:gfo/Idh/MocA family oxidoreductase [Ancylomarina euxinus]|uniref:Gfo/Idh/MocA family oxidoreductase n=1 Tax=Ancylomarina euxinus TaxID=2283627 RepID=A0A425XXS7_9BACT|nr:Gfo/Idh/MocA family oxidoreductase [Ancylomarina euxinus]MCZ4696033.1 Gfo/Idh/MocA family oxidoreductase [Ancylomarina euxinus]MUP13972.1 gfo/Idh/MocA family oxidoreductase [Ancylomarina euxinus]RRG19526.1 gfo/Idh/MocA family oxidoreductase [Ancylomarina euxinus]